MLALRSFVGLTLVIDLVVGPVLVTEVLVASILVIDLVVGPNCGGVVIVGELTVGVGIEISVRVEFCTGALPASKLILGLLRVVIDPIESSSTLSSSESSTIVLNFGGFLIFW